MVHHAPKQTRRHPWGARALAYAGLAFHHHGSGERSGLVVLARDRWPQMLVQESWCVPPKSEFRWPQDAKEAPLAAPAAQHESNSAPLTAASAQHSTQAMPTTTPGILMTRVKPVDPTATDLRLNEGRVRLLKGFYLSDSRGIGGTWEVPNYVDTFEARYGQW